MSEWQPIETAPKDGMPVWVRGWDWGKPGTSHHAGFAYWNDGRWVWGGPDGGTAEKPVGLVYIAVAGPKGTIVEEQRFAGQRSGIRTRSVNAALNLVRRYLK